MSATPAPTSAPPAKTLAGELWGGFAAMLVALPSSVAYGIAIYALLGPDYVANGVRAGILGAIALGLIAPLVGGAPRLISAPCAPAAAVLATLVSGLLTGIPGSDGPVAPERIVVLLTLVGLLSGGFQLLFGALGAGRLIKYIPYPVVSGYLSGVGVLIFLSQMPKLLGLPKGTATWDGLFSPSLWQWPALIVGGVTIASVLLAPKLTKAVPATILGLLCGLAAYFGLGAFQPGLLTLVHNPLVIGPVGGGAARVLSDFALRWSAVTSLHPGDIVAILPPALTLAVLLSVDTLKTCVVVDALTRTRHQSNRELVGQGAGNLASAFIGGMPGAGTMGATLVNLQSGGRTRLSGVIEGVCVLAAFLAFGPLIAWVPHGALAGILIVVAFRMFDWGSFALLRQRTTALDFTVIAAVIVVAVGVNLIAAAGAGLALAIMLFIREQIHGSVIRRKVTGDKMSSKQHRLPAEQAVLEKHGTLTTICELQGSLFFGTTDRLLTELTPDLARCRYLVLDLRRVHSVDYTAAHLLEQFAAMLTDRGGCLIFSRLPATLPTGQNLQAYFNQLGLTRPQENVRKFDTLDDALQWVEDRILAAELPRPEICDRALSLAEIELLREFRSDGTLDALAACVVERSCAAGQALFRAGEAGDELFLVRRGVVRVVLPLQGGNYHNLASFGAGDFFGEVAFLDRGIRSADAIATTDTDLFVISRARFNEVSLAHPLVGVKVFARLARALALRLRRTDGELRALYEA